MINPFVLSLSKDMNTLSVMKNFFVYILKCSDGSYYVGHTDNIEHRISEHQLGRSSGYTSKRLPVYVAYVATFSSRIEALSAERQIKKWTRAKKEAFINGCWDQLITLAKCRNSK